MTDEGFTVAWTGVDGERRRIRYEQRREPGEWWRIEAVYSGLSWRTVGREPVTDVEVETVFALEEADR